MFNVKAAKIRNDRLKTATLFILGRKKTLEEVKPLATLSKSDSQSITAIKEDCKKEATILFEIY